MTVLLLGTTSVQLVATKNFSSQNIQGTLDNVTFTPVPEPSSAVLVGLGAMALIMRRRK